MRVAIAAGGTGGHIIPAIALAEELKERRIKVFFIGTGKEIERKLIGNAGYELIELPYAPVLGKGLLGFLKFLIIAPLAIFKVLKAYFQLKPAVVVGFGGYPSFLPVLMAALCSIPRIIHEQNVQVGLANKFLSLISSKVFSVQRAKGFFIDSKKIEQIGNPVRKDFYGIKHWEKPITGENLCLLIIGGSQGASKINDAVLKISEFLKENNINLVHQTGENDFAKIKESYLKINYNNAQVFKFIDNIIERYASAHLIISRAGAMGVAEVLASGRPAIFIPLQIAKAHQKDNISFLCENNAAIMLEQDDSLAEKLKEEIKKLISQPEILEQMARKLKELSSVGAEGETATEKFANAISLYLE